MLPALRSAEKCQDDSCYSSDPLPPLLVWQDRSRQYSCSLGKTSVIIDCEDGTDTYDKIMFAMVSSSTSRLYSDWSEIHLKLASYMPV